MQDIIDSIDLLGDDIDRHWSNECYDRFEAALSASRNKEVLLVASLGNLIPKIKEVIYKYELSSKEEDQVALAKVKDNMERFFYYRLIENFTSQYEFDLSRCSYDEKTYNANLNEFAGLFQLITYSSDERNKKSVLIKFFIVKIMTILLGQLTRYHVKISRFTSQSISFIFSSFEIKFDDVFLIPNHYKYRDVMSSFDGHLYSFLREFEAKDFRKNALSFQRLAEYSILNVDKRSSHLPYNTLLNHFVPTNCRLFEGIKCVSLYFTLIPALGKEHLEVNSDEFTETKIDKKMRYLISLLRATLVKNEKKIRARFVEEFFIHVARLLAYDAKNDFIFKKHLQPLFEEILAIFLSSKTLDNYEILASLSRYHKDGLIESKRLKEYPDLHLFMFTSINGFLAQMLVQMMDKNHPGNSKEEVSLEDKRNFVEFLFEVVGLFVEPVLKAGKDQLLIKPCLDLIQIILAVELKLFYKTQVPFRLCKDIVNKSSLFNLKDNVNQAVLILDKLIDVAFEFCLYSTEEVKDTKKSRFKDYRDYLSAATNLISDFCDRLKAFPKVLEQAQSTIFVRLTCEPIEKQIAVSDFFTVTNNIQKIAKLDKHAIAPKDEATKNRLKNVFRIATSSQVFDSVQTENMKFYQEPANFYLNFYHRISVAVKERDDLYKLLEIDLISFMEKCVAKNDLLDENDSNSMTINYMILLNFTMNFFRKDNVHDTIINLIIDAWFNLYEDKRYHQEAKSMFTNVCSMCRNSYKKNLARKAEFLWNEYLNTTDNPIMLGTFIFDILPHSKDIFLQKFASDYFNFIYEADETVLNSGLMVEIARVAPEFYLNKEGDSEHMVIFQLIVQSNERSDDKFFTRAIGILEHLLTNLSGDPALFEKYNDELFKDRQVLFEMLPLENGQNNQSYENMRRMTLPVTLSFIKRLYMVLVMNVTDSKVKLVRAKAIIDDYFNLCRKLSMSTECSMLIQGIKEYAFHIYQQDKGVNLLLENYENFKKLKNDFGNKMITNQREELDQIIYLCEGRTIEAITSKLEENIATVSSLNKKVIDSSQKLSKLDNNLKEYESTFNDLNENMNQINMKLVDVDTKLDEQEKQIEQIDEKTLLNVPIWCKKLIKLLESKYEQPKGEDDKQNEEQSFKWMILISKRLNFNDLDIKSWLHQPDPYLSMFQEWYTINKTSDATNGLLKLFGELNLTDCVKLIEENLNELNEKAKVLNIDSEKSGNDDSKAQVFLCFEWSCLEKAKLLNKYLLENNLNTWMEDDDGKLGGGANRFNRIDVGLRKCHVLVCFVSNELAKDSNCLGQINLAVQLNKPIIPLLVDTSCKWPPAGTLGPILSEYLFIRFFQRKNELTNDERYWPVDKFNELVMQLKQIIPPSDFKLSEQASKKIKNETDVFISYQWDKQKEIKVLFNKLTGMGLKCWLDINEMGGGDSLYEKIDSGIRNTSVVVSCVTLKYSLSANCRKEVALTNSVPKPMIPIVLENGLKYPPAGPMAPILGELDYIDFSHNYKAIEAKKSAGENVQDPNDIWFGDCYDKLLDAIKANMPQTTVDRVTSRACVIS